MVSKGKILHPVFAIVVSICAFSPSCRGADVSSSPAAPAAEPPSRPDVQLVWVDDKGVLKYGAELLSSEWVWAERTPTSNLKSPALRLKIKNEFPRAWVPELLSVEGASVTTAPLKNQTTMAVDVRASRSTLRYRFTDEKGAVVEDTLVIQVEIPATRTLVSPGCAPAGMDLKIRRSGARHLFLALSCVDSAESIDLYFFRSEDSRWDPASDIAKHDPENRSTEYKSRIAKPKESNVYSTTMLPGGTMDSAGGITEYAVSYTPKIQPRRFYAGVGLGPTVYKTYKERVPGISLTQYSLTGKLSAGYRLVPKLLDVAFNIFGNLFTFDHSPRAFADGSELPAARFYGINGRLGYRLPVDLGATEFTFLAGWYLWSMQVPVTNRTKVYGVENLNGPQLFLLASRMPEGKAGFWVYGKLALISDKVRLNSLKNREIAVGGGKQLSAKERNPLSLTLDVAQVRFFSARNDMSLLSISVGVQKNIW